MANDPKAGDTSAAWRWAPAWVLAFVALWPASGVAEGVMVLGAIAAIVRLVAMRFRHGVHLLSGPAWALTSVLFFAYWLPEAVSAIDAVDRVRALREAAVDLRYLPFLWLVAMAVGLSPRWWRSLPHREQARSHREFIHRKLLPAAEP